MVAVAEAEALDEVPEAEADELLLLALLLLLDSRGFELSGPWALASMAAWRAFCLRFLDGEAEPSGFSESLGRWAAAVIVADGDSEGV